MSARDAGSQRGIIAPGRQFAQALPRGSRKPQPPGHVKLLNLLARAAGQRNFQALRASAPAMASILHKPVPRPLAPSLTDYARKARSAGSTITAD